MKYNVFHKILKIYVTTTHVLLLIVNKKIVKSKLNKIIKSGARTIWDNYFEHRKIEIKMKQNNTNSKIKIKKQRAVLIPNTYILY